MVQALLEVQVVVPVPLSHVVVLLLVIALGLARLFAHQADALGLLQFHHVDLDAHLLPIHDGLHAGDGVEGFAEAGAGEAADHGLHKGGGTSRESEREPPGEGEAMWTAGNIAWSLLRRRA